MVDGRGGRQENGRRRVGENIVKGKAKEKQGGALAYHSATIRERQ